MRVVLAPQDQNPPRVLALVFGEQSSISLDDQLLQLETVLHAKVFGLTDHDRFHFLSRSHSPKELVVLYDPATSLANTELSQSLQGAGLTQDIYASALSAYHEVLFELGACATDMLLSEATRKTGATKENDGSQISSIEACEQLSEDLRCPSVNLDITSGGFNVTPKFVRLVQALESYRHYGKEFRGVVFVRRQSVARLMVGLLKSLNGLLDFLRPQALVGSQPDNAQGDILLKFLHGEHNLLVATPSTQDLGFPGSCVVIRFDLTDSEIYQAYARFCTRGDGHLIYMVEKGNDRHRCALSRISPLRPEVAVVCHAMESSVPLSAFRGSKDFCLSAAEAEENTTSNFIQDPTTGGRIYPHDAVAAVHQFAWQASCHLNEHARYSSLFEFDVQGNTHEAYICRVTIPGMSSGPWSATCVSKGHARRAAAFQFLRTLSDAGLCDYHLFPVFGLRNPTAFEGLPALGERHAGIRTYPRKAPDFWKNSAVPISHLYPTAIRIIQSSASVKPHGPMVLLTRRPLPDMPSFRIFFSSVPATVQLIHCAPMAVDSERLQELYEYTIRVWETILNKPFDCPSDQVLGFVAPLQSEWSLELGNDGPFLPQVDAQIAWDLLHLAACEAIVPIKFKDPKELSACLEDAIIQDRWSRFTRRYEVLNIREDLSPLSKPLDPQYAEYENYIEVCKDRRLGFEGLKDDRQPLIEVLKMPVFTDRLNPAFANSQQNDRAEEAQSFIPELCAKYTIPASTFRTVMLLPCIIRRIDDLLLVKELNAKFFGHSINDHLLHMALTTPSAGIEYDYERLELLGDTFLKFLATLYVFVKIPNENEGAMHLERQKIISNKALLEAAIAVQLPPFIQSRPLSLKNFIPSIFQKTSFRGPPVKVSGDHVTAEKMDTDGPEAKNPDTTQNDSMVSSASTKKKSKKSNKVFNECESQSLGDKVKLSPDSPGPVLHVCRADNSSQAVADVAEAIIGAAYLSGGIENAFDVMKALNLPLLGVEQWSDLGRKNKAIPLAHGSATFQSESVMAIETITGCHLRRPEFLVQALTHTSTSKSQACSYERLEFIGDAILDFMVMRHIFNRNRNLGPGALTLLKGAMVSNSALAAISVHIGLHKHLIVGSPHVAAEVREYETLLQQKRQEEYRLAEKERRSPGQYWLDLEPPKALSDVVESIIGAIFLSDDFSPDGVENFFASSLRPFYDKHIRLQTLSHHPTKLLFELIQAKGCHQSQIVKEHDETLVLVHGVVLASARDTTTVSAARQVSVLALDALEGDANFLRQTCDCWTSTNKSRSRELKKQLASIDKMLALEAGRNESKDAPE
ncbi:ribonuclease III [Dendrothele bispora CBS 962.96]|uniref:Ribonuclease III n=1 Tax=Dendrothele bispora (strain CBS 962.96) TaxID=1314807 RepID=A0A4S8MZ88_DENBC|nr:ribonuclease III [Dendrothele bispora CBS 962.96]